MSGPCNSRTMQCPCIVGGLILCLYPIKGQLRDCKSAVAFHDKSINSSATSSRHPTRSHLQCAVGCMSDQVCRTYVFLPSVFECRWFRSSVHQLKDHISNIEQNPGAIVVQMCKAHEKKTSQNRKRKLQTGSHGSTCRKQSTCKFPDAVCHGRRCLCKVGFYFYPKNKTCVTRCDAYGDDMVAYKGFGMCKNIHKIVYGPEKGECLKRCRTLTKFVCVTAEWGWQRILGRVCRMSPLGYFDIPAEDRMEAKDGFYLGQRTRCE